MFKINRSTQIGLYFGLTSATITTLGLMVGLYSSTSSKLVVLGGIITIAIADACSDALGIHISEESQNDNQKGVWLATLFTFLSKFLFALTFLIPVVLLPLNWAVLVGIGWGALALIFLSWRMAKDNHNKPWITIVEHLSIAILVVIITYLTGEFIAKYFN